MINQAARDLFIADVKQAVADGAFHVAYQPVLDIQTGKVIAFEALARWTHPQFGHVRPDTFIPAAEDIGILPQLGASILDQACRAAAGWPEDVRVIVNVFAPEVMDPGFVGRVTDALSRHGIAPNRLELDLNEALYLQAGFNCLGLLHSLKELGVRLALDDFGTGYSPMSILGMFPLDAIKLDRSFVNCLGHGPQVKAVASSVAHMASAFSMIAIAEGVETQEQLDILRSLGFHAVQGYLTGRPMPVDIATAMANGTLQEAQAA